jgi:arsenical pump membrane protein
LTVHQLFIVGIAVLSIFCMLLRPRGIPEVYWACGGALLLILTRLVPMRDAAHAVRQGLDVYLFLTGMMILAEMARAEGVFDWVADIAAQYAHGSSARLFALVYLTGTVVTILLSNDATAVVLTPAVLAAVRKARVEPKPHVLACALIANAASFVLPISNPANLVVYGSHLPPLLHWLRLFLLPSVAAVVLTFVLLRLLANDDLRSRVQSLEKPAQLSPSGRLAIAGLVLACAALIVASALGADLGAPTCAAALLVLLLVTWRDHSMPRTVGKGVAWSVLPLVAGLFVIVEGLQLAGLLQAELHILQTLARWPSLPANLAAAFGVGLASNGMNNLPMGLISGAAVRAASAHDGIAHSLLIGVDLGPNLSVTGSLATILWLIALRRENVEISAWEFLKVGILVMPPALLASILLLR